MQGYHVPQQALGLLTCPEFSNALHGIVTVMSQL